MPGPRLAIKSKRAPLVKPLAGALLLLLLPLSAVADSSTPLGTTAPDGQNVPDLQDSTTPPADQPAAGDSGEDSDDAESMSVEEVHAFDPYSQWLTGAFGYFRNSGVNGSAASYFAGGGVRYGITVLDRPFLDSNGAQDAIVIEAGAFYYQVVNFITSGDSYTVVPLIGTIRYDLSFSETFTVFFYAGFMTNLAYAASGNSNDQESVREGLALNTPAAGAGLLYRVGPSWDVRADLGTDTAQLALVLRF